MAEEGSGTKLESTVEEAEFSAAKAAKLHEIRVASAQKMFDSVDTDRSGFIDRAFSCS